MVGCECFSHDSPFSSRDQANYINLMEEDYKNIVM